MVYITNIRTSDNVVHVDDAYSEARDGNIGVSVCRRMYIYDGRGVDTDMTLLGAATTDAPTCLWCAVQSDAWGR